MIALRPTSIPITTACTGDRPSTPETPMSIVMTDATTPAIAPSTVFFGLIVAKNGWRPKRLPTSSAAASLAMTANTVNTVQTRPCGCAVYSSR